MDGEQQDLAITPLAEWAAMCRELFESLVAQGFSEDQALAMVVAMMRPQGYE